MVEPFEFTQLQMCPTVKLECLFVSETLFSHDEVMPRQIVLVVAALVFLLPAGSNLIVTFKTYGEFEFSVRIPKTLSQIRVSRDQNFINF